MAACARGRSGAAMAWGAAILLIAALPIGVLVNTKTPARPS